MVGAFKTSQFTSSLRNVVSSMNGKHLETFCLCTRAPWNVSIPRLSSNRGIQNEIKNLRTSCRLAPFKSPQTFGKLTKKLPWINWKCTEEEKTPQLLNYSLNYVVSFRKKRKGFWGFAASLWRASKNFQWPCGPVYCSSCFKTKSRL